jgi:hypothetical protein
VKKYFFLGFIAIFLICCSASKNKGGNSSIHSDRSDTLRIANDELEYEVIIIEPGFNSWLLSQARPRGFYSETYLESKNQIYVMEWNSRVMQPQRYNPNLYEMQIDYNSNIHYGYEVNYLIYNYFIFFQLNYKQQLAGFVPRP